MKHIKKHPINDKAQKLSKDMKKQELVKPKTDKKLDADKSLSDPDVSMRVSKPSNNKLDGEKFLSEGLKHLKRFNEMLDPMSKWAPEKPVEKPEDDYKSLWINLAEELWVKFEKWLSEKDFELYDGREDLHKKFIEVASSDEISYEEKSTEIVGYLEDKWGLYDGYEQTRNYLDFLFLEENNLENNENS